MTNNLWGIADNIQALGVCPYAAMQVIFFDKKGDLHSYDDGTTTF